MMDLRRWLVPGLALLATLGVPMTSSVRAGQDEDLRKLGGTWLFVEDRTEGRAVEMGGAPMSVTFSLRVEKDTVIYPRSRGDERIPLDGSVIEKEEDDGAIARYRGEWTNGWLEYTLERMRSGDTKPSYVLKRVFRPTDDGLLVYVFSNKSSKQVALYRHPEDIALPEPAQATIADMEWLADAWIGTRDTSSIEERWGPPRGGAMLGVSRTVSRDKMTCVRVPAHHRTRPRPGLRRPAWRRSADQIRAHRAGQSAGRVRQSASRLPAADRVRALGRGCPERLDRLRQRPPPTLRVLA